MGTPWSITVYATDTASARRAIVAAYARVESVEQSMSDYRNDSEISRLSLAPIQVWHPVSPDLYRVLHFSLQLARWSGGAFDPTVGTLSRLWRRAFRHQEFPDRTAIERARSSVGYQYIDICEKSMRLGRDSMRLDLGGVAKGYALDVAGEVLRRAGFRAFLIDGGGDLLLGDPPPGRAAWQVSTPVGTIDTARVAIATSGATFRYLEWEGRRYSHLIDPRTGLGIEEPRSVTVYAPTGMVADGIASAVSVMGEAPWSDRRDQFPEVSVRWSLPMGHW